MKKVIRNILGNIDLEENLPLYAEEIMRSYNKYSLIRLSMNYYTYFEMLLESRGDKGIYIKRMTERINSVIKDVIVNNEVRESTTADIAGIRADIVGRTSVLTAYADIFSVYEHALNRVEHNFSDYEISSGYEDEDFCRQIMQYIFDTDDNLIINSKICEILRQLPTRIAKSKFYNMLEEALSVYKGLPEASVDDFIYMIRTCAMLERPEGFDRDFDDLREVYRDFSDIDFNNITEEQYRGAREKLYFVTDYLDDVMGKYIMLEELANDLYSVILSFSYMGKGKIQDACSMIITSVNTDFEENKSEATDVDKLFILLEGNQEELYETITKNNITADIMEKYSDTIADMGMTDIFDSLKAIEKLSSDSIFVELTDRDNNKIADESYINSRISNLTEEFGNLFKENGKHINRAVMSIVISELPVFFSNITELQDYIYNALTGCRNDAEKKACIELISRIIGED